MDVVGGMIEDEVAISLRCVRSDMVSRTRRRTYLWEAVPIKNKSMQ